MINPVVYFFIGGLGMENFVESIEHKIHKEKNDWKKNY